MQKTLRDLRIGSYDDIETATEDTTIINALHKFVDRRVSALPVIDAEGRLVDIYAKFDVIVSTSFFFSCFYLFIFEMNRNPTFWIFGLFSFRPFRFLTFLNSIDLKDSLFYKFGYIFFRPLVVFLSN